MFCGLCCKVLFYGYGDCVVSGWGNGRLAVVLCLSGGVVSCGLRYLLSDIWRIVRGASLM